MNRIFMAFILLLLLVGCDSDGNDADQLAFDEGAGSSGLPNIASEEYTDSIISLRYPSSWIANGNVPTSGINAVFSSSETNVYGGNDNCVFSYLFDPRVTLMDSVDVLSDDFYDAVPEPKIEFYELNGVPASRITGVFSTSGVKIPMVSQILARQSGQQVATVCAGSSDVEFELIFNSITFN